MLFGTQDTLMMNRELHFEVLSEDRSGGIVIKTLMERILSEKLSDPFTISVRPHRGKGRILPKENALPPPKYSSGLMDLLPAKVKAYDRVFSKRKFILVVVMDSDANPPNEVFRQLHEICCEYAPSLYHVIGICVEEIEAWLLGDEKAILSAYPKADISVIRAYSQDSVCGTWEVLARALLHERATSLIRVGYPAVGQYKTEWGTKIAPFLDHRTNKSQSFRLFEKKLLREVSSLLEAYEK